MNFYKHPVASWSLSTCKYGTILYDDEFKNQTRTIVWLMNRGWIKIIIEEIANCRRMCQLHVLMLTAEHVRIIQKIRLVDDWICYPKFPDKNVIPFVTLATM